MQILRMTTFYQIFYVEQFLAIFQQKIEEAVKETAEKHLGPCLEKKMTKILQVKQKKVVLKILSAKKGALLMDCS